MLEFLRLINDHYAQAIQALTPILLGIFASIWTGILKDLQIFKNFKNKKTDTLEYPADASIGNTFFSIGRKFKILAVHKYEIDDGTPSGYKHLGQFSRTDQWENLISVVSWLNCYHKIIPRNNEDILDIVISRNGKENWRVISINK